MLNTTARQNTTPRTVLVVEDEPTLATAIAQRITAEGWTARVAGDGASAVQAASQLRPDLVIMDIMLPVMDGLVATIGDFQRLDGLVKKVGEVELFDIQTRRTGLHTAQVQ